MNVLNDELRRRADQAGVKVANLYVKFQGHGAGDNDPWVFGSTCSDEVGALLAVAPFWVPGDYVLKALFDPRPNAAGVSTIADEIVAQLG